MNKYINVLRTVKEKAPLVQCITNFVTVNDCANIILASGASPFMSHDIREVEESIEIVNSLVCNIGCIDFIDSMILAGKKANDLGKPVIFDPVGAGATQARRDICNKLLDNIKFTVIRGNASEIRFLAGQYSTGSGVDVLQLDAITESNISEAIEMAKGLSKKVGSIIAISGVLDVITNGEQAVVLKNGCATMSRITGSGCMLSSLIGSFCGAVPNDPFLATVVAMAVMGIAGELAESRRLTNNTGNATFRNDLIDTIFNFKEKQLLEGIVYEVY